MLSVYWKYDTFSLVISFNCACTYTSSSCETAKSYEQKVTKLACYVIVIESTLYMYIYDVSIMLLIDISICGITCF